MSCCSHHTLSGMPLWRHSVISWSHSEPERRGLYLAIVILPNESVVKYYLTTIMGGAELIYNPPNIWALTFEIPDSVAAPF